MQKMSSYPAISNTIAYPNIKTLKTGKLLFPKF